MIEPRPRSIAEVALRSLNGRSFEYELADFLHEFARCGNNLMLAESPAFLQDSHEMGPVFDAYLAAVAASLATRLNFPAPEWTRATERILKYPWFASSGRHMRALLLVESPSAFRERNLFVSANALSIA